MQTLRLRRWRRRTQTHQPPANPGRFSSENDIRCHVTKRKISGGTWSDAGRQARDTLLGCMKTCQKLDVSFFQFLGHRLGVPDATEIPSLAQLVNDAKA